MSESIRAAVATALIARFGPGAVIEEWGGSEQREWSWQFGFRVGGERGGEFIAKVPRWEEARTLEAAIAAGEQANTAAEYAGLVEIADAVASSGNPGLAAVEPVAFVGGVNTIVMRRLQGIPLRSRVGIVGGRGDVSVLFGRLGEWLALFHALAGGIERVVWNATAELERLRLIEGRFTEAKAAPFGLPQAFAGLREWVGRLEGADEPATQTHGDLNLSNVLVTSDDRVAVVDPNRSRGLALDDVARVITDIRLERRQLAVGGLLRRAATADDWERRMTFAAGYSGETLLPYRLALHTLQRWIDLEATVVGPARIGLFVGRRLLRSEMKRRLDAGRSTSA